MDAPTITAELRCGRMGQRVEAETVEGRPPKTIDLATGTTSCPRSTQGSTTSGATFGSTACRLASTRSWSSSSMRTSRAALRASSGSWRFPSRAATFRSGGSSSSGTTKAPAERRGPGTYLIL